ncbi:hypothetical protein M405DRAFT_863682 [Rhizopogon salebrosus TDB-379]|nr:hypothetical protein M405DRAFT_863682 [Rhizopogon salebrosus TDB-379]
MPTYDTMTTSILYCNCWKTSSQLHGGLLGTSRSSHYITLVDDIYKNNTDELQDLASTLCHSYARATRSVPIPAPVCSSRSSHYITPVDDIYKNNMDE